VTKSSADVSLERYMAAKQLFLKLVDETDAKCCKGYDDRYGQERNLSIAEHPEIEPLRHVRLKSRNKVLAELEDIEKTCTSPSKRLIKLCQYASGITDLRFSGLFMIIFCGKLKRHFLTSPQYQDAQKLLAGRGVYGNVDTLLGAGVPALVGAQSADVVSDPFSAPRDGLRVSAPSR